MSQYLHYWVVPFILFMCSFPLGSSLVLNTHSFQWLKTSGEAQDSHATMPHAWVRVRPLHMCRPSFLGSLLYWCAPCAQQSPHTEHRISGFCTHCICINSFSFEASWTCLWLTDCTCGELSLHTFVQTYQRCLSDIDGMIKVYLRYCVVSLFATLMLWGGNLCRAESWREREIRDIDNRVWNDPAILYITYSTKTFSNT